MVFGFDVSDLFTHFVALKLNCYDSDLVAKPFQMNDVKIELKNLIKQASKSFQMSHTLDEFFKHPLSNNFH